MSDKKCNIIELEAENTILKTRIDALEKDLQWQQEQIQTSKYAIESLESTIYSLQEELHNIRYDCGY